MKQIDCAAVNTHGAMAVCVYAAAPWHSADISASLHLLLIKKRTVCSDDLRS